MKRERIISAYKTYFKDFIDTLNEAEARKVFYVIDMRRRSVSMQVLSNTYAMRYLNSELNMAETSSVCSSSLMTAMW